MRMKIERQSRRHERSKKKPAHRLREQELQFQAVKQEAGIAERKKSINVIMSLIEKWADLMQRTMLYIYFVGLHTAHTYVFFFINAGFVRGSMRTYGGTIRYEQSYDKQSKVRYRGTSHTTSTYWPRDGGLTLKLRLSHRHTSSYGSLPI